MEQIKICIIVAMDKNGVIGHGEKIPWILADDYKLNFVPKTKDCLVIMGRKTAETLPGPLKNRTNIVVSRNKNLQLKDGFIIVDNVFKAVREASNFGNIIWCIGGAQIYREFEKNFSIDEYHITYVDGEFESPWGVPEIIFKPDLSKYLEYSEESFYKREPSEKDGKRDRGNSHNFKVAIYS